MRGEKILWISGQKTKKSCHTSENSLLNTLNAESLFHTLPPPLPHLLERVLYPRTVYSPRKFPGTYVRLAESGFSCYTPRAFFPLYVPSPTLSLSLPLSPGPSTTECPVTLSFFIIHPDVCASGRGSFIRSTVDGEERAGGGKEKMKKIKNCGAMLPRETEGRDKLERGFFFRT